MIERLYRAYNLTISSCLDDLPLLAGAGQPNIVIRYGDVPDELPYATTRNIYFHTASGEAILYIPKVARYWIQNGNSITIQRDLQGNDEQVSTFLLGSAFGALLHQRGLFVLHGSAIAVDNGAILFLGRSGVGKSTLAAAFQQQGYAVITDDICAIAVHPQRSHLYPGYPQIKLKQDTCEKLGYNPTHYPQLGNQEDLKYRLSINRVVTSEPLIVKKIYVLSSESLDGICLKPVTGVALFTMLSSNTYRLNLLKGMGYAKQHFQYCSQIAQQVPITQIIRPRDNFLLPELVDMIQSNLSNLQVTVSGLF